MIASASSGPTAPERTTSTPSSTTTCSSTTTLLDHDVDTLLDPRDTPQACAARDARMQGTNLNDPDWWASRKMPRSS
jgi:hypothetical protein